MSHTASVIGSVRKGLPAERLAQIAQLLDVDRPLLLRLVGVSERTIQRKQEHAERLSPAASDRLSRTESTGWLKRPSRALANELPLQLLDTDAGAQQQ